MTERALRDRPARNPGGMECVECGCIFIGEECHARCALCEAEHMAKNDKSGALLARFNHAMEKAIDTFTSGVSEDGK